MIKRVLYITIIVFSFGFTTKSQDIVKYMVDMPSYLLPAFDSSLRSELIENHLKNKKDSIENLLGGKVKLLTLDTVSNYISFKPAPNARFEMKIFEKSDKSKVIGIINTVCGPVCSSYIRFYDVKWNEIHLRFPVLTNKNWLKSNELNDDVVKITDILEISFIELSFNPKLSTVEAKNNSFDFVSLEDKKKLEPYFEIKPISLRWTGDGFLQ